MAVKVEFAPAVVAHFCEKLLRVAVLLVFVVLCSHVIWDIKCEKAVFKVLKKYSEGLHGWKHTSKEGSSKSVLQKTVN